MLREESLECTRHAVAKFVVPAAAGQAKEFRYECLFAEGGARLDAKPARQKTCTEGLLGEEPSVVALLFRRVSGQGTQAIGQVRDVRRREDQPAARAKDAREFVDQALGSGDMFDDLDHRDAIECFVGEGQLGIEICHQADRARRPSGGHVRPRTIENHRGQRMAEPRSSDEFPLSASEIDPAAGIGREKTVGEAIPGPVRIAHSRPFGDCYRVHCSGFSRNGGLVAGRGANAHALGVQSPATVTRCMTLRS